MTDFVLKNAKIFTGGKIVSGDAAIEGGVFSKIGKNIELRGLKKIDAGGLLVLPGAIDAHVHFRDMGQRQKEDWFTGSCAAAAGGVTTVIDQPNTIPPTNNVPSMLKKLGEAKKKSIVDFGINGGVSENNLGHLGELWRSEVTAFGEIFMYEMRMEALESSFEKIKKLNAIATVHAEDAGCISMHRGTKTYEASRPGECERVAVENAIKLGGTQRLHICHLSTAKSLAIAAKNRNVTVEVTPHHFFLCDKDAKKLGAFGKMNPPLRSEADRRALWVDIGNIDIIVSDHAPHTKEEKEQGVWDAPAGVPGVETMVPLMLMAVKKKMLTLEKFVSLSTGAAKIFRLAGKGGIKVGNDADFIVVDMKAERKIRAEVLHSKCGWTPFEGFSGIFPKMVFVRGEAVYEDGKITGKKGYGRFLKPES
jgi:dihydroorotase